MNTRKKSIIVLFVFTISILFILSSLSNVQANQNDNDLEVTVHGHLDSSSTEVSSLMIPTGVYAYYETPELDVGDFNHDISLFNLNDIQNPTQNIAGIKDFEIINEINDTIGNKSLNFNNFPNYNLGVPFDTFITLDFNYTDVNYTGNTGWLIGTGYEDPNYYWSSETNAYTSNNNYASCSLNFDSGYLIVKGFNANIPANSTINGIEVQIEHKYSASNVGHDVEVKMKRAGTIGGDNKAKTSKWSTSDEVWTYGNSTDLWGLTWTVAQINAGNTGIALSSYGGSGGIYYSYIDTMQIRVYYTREDFFKNVRVNNFNYQILGVDFYENYTLLRNSANYGEKFGNYSYYFDSTFFLNYTYIDDVVVPLQNLAIVIELAFELDTNVNFHLSINYSAGNWNLPSDINLKLNGEDVDDDTYNSGYVYLDTFPNTLTFTSNPSMYFKFTSTTDFSFTFDLEIISRTHLEKEFELLSNHLVYFDRIDLSDNLNIKKIYLNNIDKGDSNPNVLSPIVSMNTGNKYKIVVILFLFFSKAV